MTNLSASQAKTITLKHALVRGETKIREIQIRKPNVPALKGLKLLDLMQSDVNAISILLPRISQPMLTKADIDRLDIVDFTELTGAIFEVMNLGDESDNTDLETGKSA